MSIIGISADNGVQLLKAKGRDFSALIARADKIRNEFFGNKIQTCAIINAKSGNCKEDCKFCPQSIHSSSEVDVYPLKEEAEIVSAARKAHQNKAHTFGIVTSGRYLDSIDEKVELCDTVASISEHTPIGPCASLGTLDEEFLHQLKLAGLVSYHHNLETAASFYSKICTTRTFKDNVETIKAAKRVGLKVCSGGLFGLGERLEQRVELFETLRELDVDSIPINFLHPREGTPLITHNPTPLAPMECLKTIAVARLMLPDKTIRVCGGREHNLREMQSWIFAAGANAVMIGSYLTTQGRQVEDDLQMITDAGMRLA